MPLAHGGMNDPKLGAVVYLTHADTTHTNPCAVNDVCISNGIL